MRTILRILAIVLTITAVAGITYAIGQTDLISQQFGRLGESGHDGGRSRVEAGNDGFERDARPDFGGGHAAERGGGFNLSAVAEFAKTLVPITLVIGLVALFSKGNQWLKRRRKNAPPPETAVS